VSGYCNDQTQQEELLIFVQDRGTPENFFPVALRIKKHVSHHFGFPVEKILPVREIPKTTSGKVQRYKLVASYRDGHFARWRLPSTPWPPAGTPKTTTPRGARG
jgi:surfactin family lipopeptide synthetase A